VGRKKACMQECEEEFTAKEKRHTQRGIREIGWRENRKVNK